MKMEINEPKSKTPIVTSELADLKFIYITLACILIAYFSLCIANPFHYWGHPYYQISGVFAVISIALLIISAVMIYSALSYAYTVYDDRIVLRYHRKPELTFYFADLIGWEEDTNDNDVFIGLTLYFPTKEISISGVDSHEKVLTHLVRKRITNNGAKLSNTIFKWLGFAALFLLFPFISGLSKDIFRLRESYKGDERIVMQKMIIEMNPTLYTFVNGNNHTGEMQFTLKGFGDYVFFLPHDSVTKGWIENTDFYQHKYDTVNIEMLKYDYDVKIAHSREPSFLDKHFDWNRIHMTRVNFVDYSIVSQKDWVLEPGDVNDN